MILTRVHPGTPERVDPDLPPGRARLLELYRPAAGSLRLNMVTDVSGNAVGADGTSESLTSRTDRKILGVIRELSDVVVVGATSVRAEGYQLPKHSRLAIVTSTGDLGGHRLSSAESGTIVVLCPPSAIGRVNETLPGAQTLPVGQGDGHLDVAAAIAALRSTGLETIVCEGGPSLAAQLLSADLVDEVCLTTSPQLDGGSLTMLPGLDGPIGLRLIQLMVDEAGFVFARWYTRELSTSG